MDVRFIASIMRVFGYTAGELVGKSRSRRIVMAREIIVNYCYVELGMTLLETGRVVNRHHSSVENMMSNYDVDKILDDEFKALLKEVDAVYSSSEDLSYEEEDWLSR